MKTLSNDQIELIDAILAERDVGGLTPAIFEKDIHVTDALYAIFGEKFSGVALYFCGGTSLSKAYHMVDRMSEDIDLKVVIDPEQAMSQSAKRLHLSALKKEVSARLEAIGFIEDLAKRSAQNANHYFASGWAYRPVYQHDATLRPELKLEITARAPVLPPQLISLTYLTDRFSGLSEDSVADILCVSPAETMAEKVLSFLRRYAQFNAGFNKQSWDDTLVRHIFDVYCMDNLQPNLMSDACLGFPALVAVDQQEFGSQFPAFIDNPKQVLVDSLAAIGCDQDVVAQYEQKLLPLIFSDQKPTFITAFNEFKREAESLLNTLK